MDYQSIQLCNLRQRTLSEIPQDSSGQIPQNLLFLKKHSENAYDLSKFLATILCSQVQMSAVESLGSHQLNSFAVFLEEKLHASSENSIVKNPQLKKMADGKKP